MDKTTLKIILGNKVVVFHPLLAEVTGSVTAALMLQQLIYWSERSQEEWFYKTIEELESETTMTRKQQDKAIDRLVANGFLEKEIRGVPPRRYFRIDYEKLTYRLEVICTKGTNQFVPKGQNLYIENTYIDKLGYKYPNDGVAPVSQEKYGNFYVNHVLEKFEELWGYQPTDAKPRWAANALVANFKKLCKEKNASWDEDRMKKLTEAYFKWVQAQDWGDKIQKIDTLRLKFRIFYAHTTKEKSN